MRKLFLRSLGFACKITDRWQQMRNFRNIVQQGISLALCRLQSFGKGAEDKEARKKNEPCDAGRDGERPGCARDVPGAAIIRIEENRFCHVPSYRRRTRAIAPAISKPRIAIDAGGDAANQMFRDQIIREL